MSDKIPKWEQWQWVVFIVPLLLGLSTSNICGGMSKEAINIKGRPANYIFTLVWIVLFLLLGASFNFTWNDSTDDPSTNEKPNRKWIVGLYSVTIALLALWPIIYSCYSKKYALWLLLIIITLVLSCWSLSPWYSKLCLDPLITWTIFAMVLTFKVLN